MDLRLQEGVDACFGGLGSVQESVLGFLGTLGPYLYNKKTV